MSSNKFNKQNAKIKFSHIFLICTIKTAILTSSTEAIKIKCTNTDDFYFTNPGSQCSKYYKCTSKGQKETIDCSHGMKFDFYKQNCSHSPGASCGDPTCQGRANGIYQDTAHACMRSFTCYAGQLTSIDNCPLKHLHNGQKCVHQDLVTCSPVSSTTVQKLSSDRRCANRLDDGLYAADESCTKYIVCTAGKASDVRSCPYDYRFHAASQECLPKHMVLECSSHTDLNEQICRNKRDGPVADPTSKDCTTYVVCKSGNVESHQRCSNQAVFNGESCVPSPLHQCSLSKRHADFRALDQCHRKPNGYYSNPQHGCTSYVRCTSDRVVEVGVCPVGQYFDPEIRKCIVERAQERRRCFERGASMDCSTRSDGFYAEAKCESYYYCYSGHKIEYKCPNSKVFNGKNCVSKTEYKCPKVDGDNFCYSRPDGYYKDSNDGCRAYNYCSNGHKITYLCEPGYAFDSNSKKCLRKEQLGQHHCHSDSICYGKSDGYHADVQSNCRNYIYCKNYEKITQLTCRDNRVFNGLKCVHTREYACPSLYNHRQANCVPRNCLSRCESDGFYVDLNSDCSDYHICIGGKSSKISCPSGKRFNGEICVAEDKFTCPVVCTHKHEVEGECPLGGYVA